MPVPCMNLRINMMPVLINILVQNWIYQSARRISLLPMNRINVIACGRCVRICNDVVMGSTLEFINRGF